uniref:Uncharacterized protein n=1 Tax=Anguilla anguilla TaxID=7936 RepID=A0A0E9VRC9_ANGAN
MLKCIWEPTSLKFPKYL